MRRGRFDIGEYLLQLQWARTERKKKPKPPSLPKTRYCRYSRDPVQDDLIWKSVMRGETTAAERRQNDYASAQLLYQSTSGSASGSKNDDGGDDDGVECLERLPLHVTPGPPLPTTSNGYIGWRSSLPYLQLERYGAYT